MRRRRKHHQHAGHERWLVSYADFITLLFAFFVVLYASSQMDKKKVVQVSAAIRGAFEQLGAFSGNAAEAAQAPGDSSVAVLQTQKDAVVPGLGEEAAPDVTRLKDELRQALGEQIQKHEIEIHS